MQRGPWDDEPVTERVARPCGWCGAPSLGLRPCPMPPLTMHFSECMFAGPYEDPVWRICARSQPGRFSGRFDPVPPVT